MGGRRIEDPSLPPPKLKLKLRLRLSLAIGDNGIMQTIVILK